MQLTLPPRIASHAATAVANHGLLARARTMSVSPDIIFQAVDLVRKAIDIYHRVEGLPKQMDALGRRLEKLSFFLGHLAGFIKARPDTAYDHLLAGQKGELADIVESIKGNVAAAYDLFERYEKGILSRQHDMQFRVKWAAQMWFALVDNTPEKVGALMEDIDRDRTFLSDYLGLMNAQGIEHLVNKGKGRAPSPSPQSPARKDYTVVFVDPYNQARSVVAAAWVGLLKAWTLERKSEWCIEHWLSAGFFVQNKCDCVDVINGLDYTYKSFKKPFKEGGAKPDWTPRAALFQNKRYNYPHKKIIEDRVGSWTSRGVRKGIFQDYDYIVVFTNREHDNMIKLKNALVKHGGRSAAPRGKGRLLMLGAYLSPAAEILDPPKNKDGTNNRENWDRAVAQIKSAVEGFLKEEFQWQEPGDLL